MAYYDLTDGTELSDDDLDARYAEMLDEVVGEVSIGTLTYDASRVLREVDPIAYRVGFSDWVDAETGETITDDEDEARRIRGED